MKEQINVRNLNQDLIKAAKHGAYKLVELLLDAGADVNAEDDWALRWASSRGHYDVMELLLDRGADVNAWNDDALRWASMRGRHGVAKLLLDRGANPEEVCLDFVDDDEVKELILDARRKIA